MRYLKMIITKSRSIEFNDEDIDEDEYYVSEDCVLIDIESEMDTIYKIMLDIIKNYKWEYLHYVGVDEWSNNNNNFNPTQFQIDNKLKTMRVTFYPNLSEIREEVLDKLIDN